MTLLSMVQRYSLHQNEGTGLSPSPPPRFDIGQQLIDPVVALEQGKALLDVLLRELRSGYANRLSVLHFAPHSVESGGVLFRIDGHPRLGRFAHRARPPV